jgi:hypothetical protein
VLVVLKSGSLNLLEPSGPVKANNGIVLPLLCKQDYTFKAFVNAVMNLPEFLDYLKTG